MTQTDLAGLLAERTAALEAPRRSKPWRSLTPEQRAAEAALINRHERAEALIVELLRGQAGPVTVSGVTLHLNRSRDGFVELDPESGRALQLRPSDPDTSWQSLLYRYPDVGRQNRPESIP